MQNKEVAKELHKPIIGKFQKRKVQLFFIIFGVLILKICNQEVNLLKDLDIYYVLLIFIVNMHGLFPQNKKKSITITDAFQKILYESDLKPSKIWVDKGSKFYIRSMKSQVKII